MKLSFKLGVIGVTLYVIGIIFRYLFLIPCVALTECSQPIEVTIFSIIAYVGAILAIGAMIAMIYKKITRKK